jgi:hypothetical protein
VLLAVDLTAVAVLLPVDLLALLRVQATTVGSAVVVYLLIDAGLIVIGAACLR